MKVNWSVQCSWETLVVNLVVWMWSYLENPIRRVSGVANRCSTSCFRCLMPEQGDAFLPYCRDMKVWKSRIACCCKYCQLIRHVTTFKIYFVMPFKKGPVLSATCVTWMEIWFLVHRSRCTHNNNNYTIIIPKLRQWGTLGHGHNENQIESWRFETSRNQTFLDGGTAKTHSHDLQPRVTQTLRVPGNFPPEPPPPTPPPTPLADPWCVPYVHAIVKLANTNGTEHDHAGKHPHKGRVRELQRPDSTDVHMVPY